MNASDGNGTHLARLGLSRKVRREHVRLLRRVAAFNDPSLSPSMPLVTFLVLWIERQSAERGWAPQTLARNMASLQGALAQLPLYVPGHCPVPLRLNNEPEWTAAMRAAQALAREATTREPAPLTLAHIEALCRQATPSTRYLLQIVTLSWLVAGRVGDVTQLCRQDVSLQPDGTLTVTFRKGKGVTMRRQQYTVFTRAGRFHQIIADLLQECQTTHLWELPSPQDRERLVASVRDFLRVAQADLECRSIRRGALQFMATQKVTEEVLMHFSGHQRVETLRRYLSWGRINGAVCAAARPAAMLLAAEGPSAAPGARSAASVRPRARISA
jgi:hypothetical protein